jgi:RNA polymerase sigma-70 factor (ECF subfamily)
MDTTRPSLLRRIRDPGDRAAWEAFDAIYRPLLLRYARALGLAHADAEDAAQHVLAILSQRMASFDYDSGRGRFRGWLRTIVVNHVRNLARSRNADARARGAAAEQADGGHGLSPEEIFDRLWMQEHLWHCLRELQGEVDERTWEVFHRLVFEGAPVAAICRELHVEPGNVYTIRWRLTRSIAQKMELLTDGDSGA